jgi:hypothetical protein
MQISLFGANRGCPWRTNSKADYGFAQQAFASRLSERNYPNGAGGQAPVAQTPRFVPGSTTDDDRGIWAIANLGLPTGILCAVTGPSASDPALIIRSCHDTTA